MEQPKVIPSSALFGEHHFTGIDERIYCDAPTTDLTKEHIVPNGWAAT